MVEINGYMEAFIEKMREYFGGRLRYVGLQGSYLRQEVTKNSDIDVMVLLDGFGVEDMDAYRRILTELGHYEASCGFICDTEEFCRWNRLELCHVLHGTRDYYGYLSDFVPEYSQENVRQFTKMSLNNLYHALCHSYIHRGPDRTYPKLAGLFKSCFFVLQGIKYLETGEFIGTKRELLEKLDGTDRKVLEYAMGREISRPEEAFRLLFDWCGGKIRSIE